MKKKLSFIAGFLLILALILPATALAVPEVTPYQAAPGSQITAGELVYQANCASCHGSSAEGGFGPPIAGQSAAEITAALASVEAMSGISITEQEINAVANFLQFLAVPQITLTQPASGQFNAGAQNTIGIAVSSPASPITSAEFQTFFGDATGTLAAASIFNQTSVTVPTPRTGGATTPDPTAVPAGLPPSSVVSLVVTGTVTAVNPATGEWQIGTPPIFVYESASTTFLGIPTAGDNVRIEAMRTLASGPIVAKQVARTAGGTLPAPAAIKEMSFLFNGTIESAQPPEQSAGIKLGGERWTIGGVQFLVDDWRSPAIVDPGIDVGTAVTVQFRPLPAGTSSNTALQIFAPQASNVIPATLNPDPIPDTELSPSNLPAGSWRQFVIAGVVTAINAAGDWTIGAPPVIVFRSASTTISDPAPLVGDEVLVIARRTVDAGPIVADSIAFVATRSLPAGPPVVDKSFMFNGTVGTTGAASWTVGGTSFVVNDPQMPAVIGAGLVAGSDVTVEFKVNLPATPDETLWASFDFNPAISTGSATLTPPSVTVSRSGFVFLRATNADLQVTTIAVPATLLTAAPPVVVGGGGGGGGAPVPTTVGLSGLTGDTLLVNSSGVAQSAVTLQNADGNLTIDIASGTTLKTATGSPLVSISLTSPLTVPQAPPQNAVVVAYNLEPAGATFDPPITLTLAYDPAALPAGMDEDSLVIAWWDGTEWVMLPSTVDATANTISAEVSHFTIFAILGESPPEPAPQPPQPAPEPTPTPTPTPTPAPAPTPPTPAPTTTPAPEAPPAGPNWGLIVGIIAAVIVGLALGFYFVRRRRTEA